MIEDNKQQERDKYNTLFPSEFSKRVFLCIECKFEYANELGLRIHMQTVHDCPSLFWDLNEDSQRKSLKSLELYSREFARHKTNLEPCGKIKKGKLQCGCISKHNIEHYDDDKKNLFWFMHFLSCHQATSCCNKCGITISSNFLENHMSNDCDD